MRGVSSPTVPSSNPRFKVDHVNLNIGEYSVLLWRTLNALFRVLRTC